MTPFPQLTLSAFAAGARSESFDQSTGSYYDAAESR